PSSPILRASFPSPTLFRSGVCVDAVGEVGADGAGSGVLRIGGAHQVAVLQDGVLAFKCLDHYRARGHELHQRVEERTLAVDGVEDRKSTRLNSSHVKISYA